MCHPYDVLSFHLNHLLLNQSKPIHLPFGKIHFSSILVLLVPFLINKYYFQNKFLQNQIQFFYTWCQTLHTPNYSCVSTSQWFRHLLVPISITSLALLFELGLPFLLILGSCHQLLIQRLVLYRHHCILHSSRQQNDLLFDGYHLESLYLQITAKQSYFCKYEFLCRLRYKFLQHRYLGFLKSLQCSNPKSYFANDLNVKVCLY